MSTPSIELLRSRERAKAQTVALMAVDNLILDKESDERLSMLVRGELTASQALDQLLAHVVSKYRMPVYNYTSVPRKHIPAPTMSRETELVSALYNG